MSRTRMMNASPASDEEPASPRTTIVGGQPQEHPGTVPVPTGIQVLLRLAALDPAFRRQLTERRGDVAQAAGVDLTPSERAILAAIPAAQLEQVAASMPPPPPPRREFLRKTAATAVVLLGGAAMAEPLAGCIGECVPRSDRTQMPLTGGAAPDLPPTDTSQPPPEQPVQGEDEDDDDDDVIPEASEGKQEAEEAPERPERRPQKTGGISPSLRRKHTE